MKIRTLASKLKQWLKPCLFIILATITCSAYAEYYFVYPAPAFGCREECYLHPYHRIHYHHVHHRWAKHHRTVYVPYYLPVVVPPCDRYYYDNDIYNYDPDLSTGDDNQSIHPDMDIDY